MPAIQVNFQGKEEDRDWTPQPPTGKIGTALVLPPDCKVAYTQRLLRKGPKLWAVTGREREADGLLAVWDEHLGKTLYKAKMDSKNKIMSVYREGRPPVTPAGKIATMALDGKSGLAGDTSDINLPNGQNGPVGSVFRKSGGFIFKGNSRSFTVGSTTYKWKTLPIHSELPDLGYFFELQDDKKATIATTQRLDESSDGHPVDEDADQYPIYLTPACYPIIETVVSTVLFLERL